MSTHDDFDDLLVRAADLERANQDLRERNRELEQRMQHRPTQAEIEAAIAASAHRLRELFGVAILLTIAAAVLFAIVQLE
jgi:hypothetical protein